MISESTKIKVREATKADTPAMISIINAAFSVEDFLAGTRTDAERIEDYWRGGTFLVAEDEGRIVASIYVELRGDRAYFGMLAVDPSQQGRGLARTMTQAAEDYARQRGSKFMDISVLSLRPELPPLYRKFGYVENGTGEFRPSRPLKPGYECHIIRMTKLL